jgi:hypothetical protein
MKEIKEELKNTRKQRDEYKSKYNQSLISEDGKNVEFISMIKDAIEKLIAEIQITYIVLTLALEHKNY